MVPPGASFEFFEGPLFKARTKDAPELAAALEVFVRDHFDRLQKIDDDIRHGLIVFQGRSYGFVVYRLKGNRLSLYQIWDDTTGKLDPRVIESLKKRRKA